MNSVKSAKPQTANCEDSEPANPATLASSECGAASATLAGLWETFVRRLAAFLSFPPYTQRLLQTCNYQPASREPARLVIAKSANCKSSGAPLPPFPFCEPATPSPILSHLCTLLSARPPRFPFPHTLRVSQLCYLRPAKPAKSANCELRILANCEHCELRILAKLRTANPLRQL